jgi:hypothetical protein
MNSSNAPPTPVACALAILAALLSLPALVVPFVSFAWSDSPLDTVVWVFGGGWGWEFALLGAPFFLGFPIVAAQIARVASLNIPRGWRAVGFALAACSAALSLTFVGRWALEIARQRDSADLIAWMSMFLVPAFLATGAFWVWRTRQTASATARHHLTLATAYLANASMCLVVFRAHSDFGWWLALVACAGIVLDAVQTVVAAPRTAG